MSATTPNATEMVESLERPAEVRNDPAWDAKPTLIEVCHKAKMFDAAMAIIPDDYFIDDQPMNADGGVHRTRKGGASLSPWDVEYGSIQWDVLMMANCLLRLRTHNRSREGWAWEAIDRAAEHLAASLQEAQP